MAGKPIGSAEYRVGADLRPLRKELDKVPGLFGAQAAVIKKGVLSGFGIGGGFLAFSAISKGIGMVGGAITGAIGAARDFEAGLATVNTVAKLSQRELGALGKKVQDLSEESGKSTDELTQALYDLVSASVSANDAMGVLRDSTTLSEAALSTTGEAVDLVTTSLNAWKIAASESSRVTDVWSKTVANGKVTASELASSIAKVAPIAAAAGVSIEEVAAAYASMTAQGTPAAQSATQMQAAITALLKPNERLLTLQKSLNGTTFEAMLRSDGLAATLQAVSDAADGDTASITKALGSTEAYNGLLQLTGGNAEAFTGNLQAMRKAASEGGTAIGMAAERTKTLEFRQKQLAAKQKRFAQDVGEALMPFMRGVTELGIGVVETLRGMASGIDAIIKGAQRFADPGRDLREELAAFSDMMGPGMARSFALYQRSMALTGDTNDELMSNLRLLQITTKQTGPIFAELADIARETDTPLNVVQDRMRELATAMQGDGFNQPGPGEVAVGIGEAFKTLRIEFGLQETATRSATEATKEDTTAKQEALTMLRGFLKDNPKWVGMMQDLFRAQGSITEALKVSGMAGRAARRELLSTDGKVKTSKQIWHSFFRVIGPLAKTLPESVAAAVNAVPHAITAGKADVKKAMREYRFAMEHPFQGKGYLQWLARKQKKVQHELKAAIKAGDPERVALATAMLADLQGKEADFKGLRDASIQRGQDIIDGFKEHKAEAKGIGKGYIEQAALGLKMTTQLENAAKAAAQVIADFLKTGSPAKRGPLSLAGGPEGWGQKVARLFARGLVSERVDVAAMLGAGAPSLSLAATMAGPSRVEHSGTIVHELAPAAAQELAAAGFDEDRLAQLLRSDASDLRYRWAG